MFSKKLGTSNSHSPMSDSHSSVLLKETHDVEVGEHTAGYTMDSKKIKNILKKLNVMQAAAENRTEFDR